MNEIAPLAGIGDNSIAAMTPDDFDPLAYSVDVLPDALANVFYSDLERCEALLAGFDRLNDLHPTIEDEDTKARATSFVAQIKIASKKSTEAHKRVKDPFLKGGRHVDGFFKRRISEPLDAAAKAIEAKMTAYDRKVVERRRAEAEAAAKAAAEEAARLAATAESTMRPDALEAAIGAATVAEEAAALAAAKSSDLSRTYGNYGGVASPSDNWTWEEIEGGLLALVKAAAADPSLLRFLSFKETAITQAVKGSEKAREIPGVRIFNNMKTVVRV